MGNENAGAKQAQKRRNRLNHRKYPLRPKADRTTCPAAQSKEFQIEFENRTRVMIWRNSWPGGQTRRRPGGRRQDLRSVNPRIATATIHSPRPRSPHFRRLRAAVCSYVDAEVGCIRDIAQPGAQK